MTNITPINNNDITPEVSDLITKVTDELENGLEQARLSMEAQKRQVYWNIGKHIKEHLLKNSDRADYGAYVVQVLSDNTQIDRSDLYKSIKLYDCYPEIVDTNPQLTWSHMKSLIAIEDKELRHHYEQVVVEQNLKVKDLKTLIKLDKEGDVEPPRPEIKLTRTPPWNYRFRNIEGSDLLDLGFHYYMPIPDGVIDAKYDFNNEDTTSEPFYTYKAHVVDVIDGDTLWVNIDLGFNHWTNQKLRLRSINTKEIDSKEGQKAKNFVANRLAKCKCIVVKTYWRDKFTRYLADVFYDHNSDDEYYIAEHGSYLNQELLDEGLAYKK